MIRLTFCALLLIPPAPLTAEDDQAEGFLEQETTEVTDKPLKRCRVWTSKGGTKRGGTYQGYDSNAKAAILDISVSSGGMFIPVRMKIKVSDLSLNDQVIVRRLIAEDQQKRDQTELGIVQDKTTPTTPTQTIPVPSPVPARLTSPNGQSIQLIQWLPGTGAIVNRRDVCRGEVSLKTEKATAVGRFLNWWDRIGYCPGLGDEDEKRAWNRLLHETGDDAVRMVEAFLAKAGRSPSRFESLEIREVTPAVLSAAAQGVDIALLHICVVDSRRLKSKHWAALAEADERGRISFALWDNLFEATLVPALSQETEIGMAWHLEVVPNRESDKLVSDRQALCLPDSNATADCCLMIISPQL